MGQALPLRWRLTSRLTSISPGHLQLRLHCVVYNSHTVVLQSKLAATTISSGQTGLAITTAGCEASREQETAQDTRLPHVSSLELDTGCQWRSTQLHMSGVRQNTVGWTRPRFPRLTRHADSGPNNGDDHNTAFTLTQSGINVDRSNEGRLYVRNDVGTADITRADADTQLLFDYCLFDDFVIKIQTVKTTLQRRGTCQQICCQRAAQAPTRRSSDPAAVGGQAAPDLPYWL